MKRLTILGLAIFCLMSAGQSCGAADTVNWGTTNAMNDNAKCSGGWKITGYFTPVEADYQDGETEEIAVRGISGKQRFNARFLKVIITEGWGRTKNDWYLGYDHETQSWTKAAAPLDNHGGALEIGMIAADAGTLKQNSKITIPSLPGEWGKLVYTVTDIGLSPTGEVSVKNKHIDVYTGEGKNAEQQTFAVTREAPAELVEVCFAD